MNIYQVECNGSGWDMEASSMATAAGRFIRRHGRRQREINLTIRLLHSKMTWEQYQNTEEFEATHDAETP